MDVFVDKQKDFEKRQKEEMKKVEKVLTKETTQMEELYNDASMSAQQKVKQLREKLGKMVTEQGKADKSLKMLDSAIKEHEEKLDLLK